MKCTVAVEQRKEERYGVFIKVVAKGISQFPGCVEEVSKSGCRIDFTDVEEIDFESEYAATVYPQPSGRAESECFDLLLKPNWIQRNGTGAVIGFSVLCTPGYRSFIRFVERIAEEDSEASAE